ncbi:MAG: GTP-binding protein [Spirochaetales bacterium]|nr:GTP-binding protein [Spirochaetales bacterium]
MNKKIDIIVLAGFLGAGKTTVLNELVRTFHDRKLGMLVNDFGEVPVDGSLLKNENPELLEEGHKIYEIGNGSIFCSCLKAPFLYGLKYFEKEQPDLLFIEASGLSDPSSMSKILSDHNLDDSFEIKQIVTLIDPVRYKALIHVLDVIDRQIQAADHILVNKTDLIPLREVDELLSDLAGRSSAPCQTGSFGQFDYSFILSSQTAERYAPMESCNTPETRPGSLFLQGNFTDKQSLKDFLSRVEGAHYRLKGFVDIEGSVFYVSDNSRGYSITPAQKPGIRRGLTVLCPKENEEKILQLWKELEGAAL